LIFDAGDGADLLLRYLATGGAGAYEVVGFLDDDEFNRGRRIHDIDVFGGTGDAREILQVHDVVGVIAVPGASKRPGFSALQIACAETGVWIRELRIGFEEI
jgi:FlaA1/EpsC-like NDP-sugar epimerase